MHRKPTTPEGHAGIFQEFKEIPARYRLSTYASYYQGQDTLKQYYEDVYFPKHAPVSEAMQKRADRTREYWLDHMQSRGHHHALATPNDVNAWCQSLLESRTVSTIYKTYFRRIFNFYDYLKRTYQHPHLYNPVLLAAVENESAYEIWQYRIKDRPSHNESES